MSPRDTDGGAAGIRGPRKVETLNGAQRLAAFGGLPPEMQAGAFLALRETIEDRREQEREG